MKMRILSLCATVASLVAAVAGSESRDHNGRSSLTSKKPLRVMIVGDSITHGAEGDFTWRYRIWEWFRANNVSVDFVGPYQGTIERDLPLPPQPPYVIGDAAPPLFVKTRIPWGYADAVSKDFDPDHFSTGGYKAELAKDVIRDLTKKYQPEVVLCLIGINDFIWSLAAPEVLLASMKSIVDEMRIATPNAKFAIGNVVRRKTRDSGLDVRTTHYNPLLKAAVPTWSTKKSPAYHVDVAAAYACGGERLHCPASFDGLHPSALGEYQIAMAFAQSLMDNFGIGQKPLKIPVVMPVNRTFRPPKNVKAQGSSLGVKVTWDHRYGMTSYRVQWRIAGKFWQEEYVGMNRFDTITETPGIEYEYKIRACHGNRCGKFSKVVKAMSDRHTAPPPRNFRMESMDSEFRVSWSPPENSDKWNITMYEISLRNMAEEEWNAVGSRRFTEKITGFFGLPKGSIWSVRMATWTYPEGKGLYAYTRPVMEGGGEPAQPQGLQARYISPTSAHLTWNVSANAAGYLVYYRSSGEHGRGQFMTDSNVIVGVPLRMLDGSTGFHPPKTTIQNLDLGRGEYEFCVTALNGEVESKTQCVTPGKSSIAHHPVDLLGSLSMNSTIWFCALLLVAVFLAMARRKRELPAFFESKGLAEVQKAKMDGATTSQTENLPYDRLE